MSSANERQEGGNHYRSEIQHWDYVWKNDLGYFEGQITKYVTRWRKKNGLEDLLKAKHFLDKLIEIATEEGVKHNKARADAEAWIAERFETKENLNRIVNGG